MDLSEFLDRYWWAVFLFLFFVASVVLRPATPRSKRRAGAGAASTEGGEGPASDGTSGGCDSDGGD